MAAALNLARWRLRRAVHVMGRAGIGGVALMVVAAGFALSSVLPLQDRLTALRDRVDRLETRAGRPAQDPEGLRFDTRLAAFYEQLPAPERAPDVVRRLHAQAADAGLYLERGDYRPLADESGRLMRYELVLPVTGSYPRLKRFLALAMHDTPGLALDGILMRRKPGASDVLDAQLRFTVFMRAAS